MEWCLYVTSRYTIKPNSEQINDLSITPHLQPGEINSNSNRNGKATATASGAGQRNRSKNAKGSTWMSVYVGIQFVDLVLFVWWGFDYRDPGVGGGKRGRQLGAHAEDV